MRVLHLLDSLISKIQWPIKTSSYDRYVCIVHVLYMYCR